MGIKRRDFLRIATVGIAALSLKSLGCSLQPAHHTHTPTHVGFADFSLNIGEALVQMVDGTFVYMWTFEDAQTGAPRFPGPVINVFSGDEVNISITNTLDEDHAFSIPGVVDSGPIPPGQTQFIRFIAPAAGTYLYFDPLNAPVNRVLGLHGAMVVLPDVPANNPYTSPSAAVRDLFNDLGNTANFPGESFNPDPAAPKRSRIWLFTQVDPRFNAQARGGTVINATQFRQNFLPRYFTINGESGAFSSNNHDTTPSGRIGQPHLIRMLNAGLANHSPHIHGNHVFVVSARNAGITPVSVSADNVFFIDTFTVGPLDIVDWLLPFHRPPDIAGNQATPLRVLLKNELALVLGDVPQSPLMFPMHCHMEMSQTAAGGNYPQGLVTHYEITGDVDGVDFPIPPVKL